MSGPAIDRGTGTVYIGSHDANLYALDFATGDLKWQVDTGGFVIGCPTVTAQQVLVGSYAEEGYLTAYNKTTGDQLWRVTHDGWITSTPRVTSEGIYYMERATDTDAGSAYKLVDAS
jgi:outer membrane protein assembly factor BamB